MCVFVWLQRDNTLSFSYMILRLYQDVGSLITPVVLANPSPNVVSSHPVTDSSTQLSCFGQHHHHFTGITSVAASQCYLSLLSLRWAIGAERLGKLKPHRCAAIVARYSLQGDSIYLLSSLVKHWSRWNSAGVQTREELVSKTPHYPVWDCNYLMSIILYFTKEFCHPK